MLTSAERARLTVILVGARNPGNIGAAARAMHDFGFTDLRVVNAFAPPLEAAQLAAADTADHESKSAVHSGHILAAARRYDSLAPALVDCSLVVGTTAIGGRELKKPVVPIKDAAPQLLRTLVSLGEQDAAAPGRVAVLFGSEKTGLTREQLSHCSLLTTIPMYAPVDGEGQPARHLSMNLGQSVAVCLYELTRAGFEGARAMPLIVEPPSTSDDRERMARLLTHVMESSGYARRYPHNASTEHVRQLAAELTRNHHRAVTWMGILRQVLRPPHDAPPGDASPEQNQT